MALIVEGSLDRRPQTATECLREEDRPRPLRCTAAQRRWLAVAGKELGRRLLQGAATLVTPDAIPACRRWLVAHKWTHPGVHGGEIVASAPPHEVARHAASPTGKYLRHEARIAVREQRGGCTVLGPWSPWFMKSVFGFTESVNPNADSEKLGSCAEASLVRPWQPPEVSVALALTHTERDCRLKFLSRANLKFRTQRAPAVPQRCARDTSSS